MRRALWSAAAIAVALGVIASATAGRGNDFTTDQASMLTPVATGATVTPLLTVGERLRSGYRFESLPDGISINTRGQGLLDLFVNHETSYVPFPYTPAAPTEANSQNDFDNSQLSHLVLNQQTGGIQSAQLEITSAENFQRFCSNFLGTREHGFDKPLLFTNEEGIDWVNRTGKAFPAVIGADEARQIGTVVAFDPRTGQHRAIWGMGRLNHENSLAIPGYGKPVLLTGDDAFVNVPAQSQIYSYIGADSDAVWNDEGELWAFVSDTPGYNDYEDFAPGSAVSIHGHFVQVPKNIATGRNPDGTDLLAADVGYPPPPNTGWQTSGGVGIDGPQWVLEHWSDVHDVFQFVRVEDMAYDKRPGHGNEVYVVDSGRGTTGAPAAGKSTNGRIWKMVLDPSDPTQVTSLSILIEGDDNPVKTPGEIHQPDNIESTVNSLLVTEDPGSSQQFNPGETNATTARLMRYDFATGLVSVAARIDQSADEGPTDVDAAAAGRLGAWESSGVIDASAVYGPGAFLLTVQAHTLWVEKAPGDDDVAPFGVPDYTLKREGGQLVLLRIPGA
jgi:hypothetical protein